jgi:rhodanese-related sulfurtransferase
MHTLNASAALSFHRLIAGCIVLLAGLSLPGCQPAVSDADLVPVSVLEARNLWNQAQTTPKAALFLDPRSERAFEAEHIPGARNVEIASAAERARIAETASNRPFWERARLGQADATLADFDALVVYADNAGSASSKVLAKLLLRQRFRNVYLLEGGLLDWKNRGGPTAGNNARAGSAGGSPVTSAPEAPTKN